MPNRRNWRTNTYYNIFQNPYGRNAQERWAYRFLFAHSRYGYYRLLLAMSFRSKKSIQCDVERKNSFTYCLSWWRGYAIGTVYRLTSSALMHDERALGSRLPCPMGENFGEALSPHVLVGMIKSVHGKINTLSSFVFSFWKRSLS